MRLLLRGEQPYGHYPDDPLALNPTSWIEKKPQKTLV